MKNQIEDPSGAGDPPAAQAPGVVPPAKATAPRAERRGRLRRGGYLVAFYVMLIALFCALILKIWR